MYELVGWSILVEQTKMMYDALQCNDVDTKYIAEKLKEAIDKFGSANRMDAIDWRKW